MKALREKPIESPEKIADFLRCSEEVGCVRVEVRHIVAGTEGMSPVATFDITKEDDTDGEHFNAEEVYSRMVTDAEAVGGVQRYALLAFREATRTPRDRLLISVDGGSSDSDASISPVNANQAALALVAQSHKFIENIMKSHTSAIHGLVGTLAGQMKVMADRLEKSDDERVEMWGMLKEMQTHDREKIELQAKIVREEQQADVVKDGIKLLLPAIVSKILPGAKVADEAMTRIIKSLSPEQMTTIFGALTPEQQVAFGVFLESQEKKEAKEKNNAS